MTKEEYFGDWLKVIEPTMLTSILPVINRLYQSQSVMPKYEDIFKAFHICPYNELKAVFIGQDPYPQKGVATGILFGNKEDTCQLSPSLEVVKEACIDYTIPHGQIQFDVTLETWAKQGILMINSALTVKQDTPNSHTMLWRPFISKLLKNLSNTETGIIYVLFGEQAKTFRPYIYNKYNRILEEQHPAYYARTKTKMPTRLFKYINRLIVNRYGEPIEWYKEDMHIVHE